MASRTRVSTFNDLLYNIRAAGYLAVFVLHLLTACTLLTELSIDVKAAGTSAIVTFKHSNPQGMVRYEASINGDSKKKCSVAASAQFLRCTVNGIPEALEFYINADAYFSGPPYYQGFILGPYRSTMRRMHYF